METWLPRVEQVIVVDSFSTDGTAELLQANLVHPRLSFFKHPPGLYQSWNFGISHISARYVYIATAGDIIESTGLQKLVEAAEHFQADVVLSKPRFYGSDGAALPDVCWPIDELTAALKITTPRRLSRMGALVFALTSGTSALTGSCASDLFRTDCLHRFPFPTGYGPAGDGAWCIQHAADLVWAIVPGRFSRFVRHPSNASSAERNDYRAAPRLDQVARQTVQQALQSGLLTRQELEALGIEELLARFAEFLDAKELYDQKRRDVVPWILSPNAWRARSGRNRSSTRLLEVKARALQLAVSCPVKETALRSSLDSQQ
jgi:glycosyltransferase involved in cell wall biosynthesis